MQEDMRRSRRFRCPAKKCMRGVCRPFAEPALRRTVDEAAARQLHGLGHQSHQQYRHGDHSGTCFDQPADRDPERPPRLDCSHDWNADRQGLCHLAGVELHDGHPHRYRLDPNHGAASGLRDLGPRHGSLGPNQFGSFKGIVLCAFHLSGTSSDKCQLRLAFRGGRRLLGHN